MAGRPQINLFSLHSRGIKCFRSWIFLQFWHSDSHLSYRSACKNRYAWWFVVFVGFDTKICVSNSAADHQWWHWIDTEATRLWCVWNLKGLLGPRLYSVCLIKFKRFVFLVILLFVCFFFLLYNQTYAVFYPNGNWCLLNTVSLDLLKVSGQLWVWCAVFFYR